MLPLNSHSIDAIKRSNLSLGNSRLRAGEVLFFILAAAIIRVWLALALQGKYWRDAELNELVNRFVEGKGLRDFYQKRWGIREEKEVRDEILSYFQRQWDTVLQILPKLPEGRSLIQEIFHVQEQLHTSDELIFLFYGMRYFRTYAWKQRKGANERANGNEERIVKCLMQYLRIKNYVFGCTVQK